MLAVVFFGCDSLDAHAFRRGRVPKSVHPFVADDVLRCVERHLNRLSDADPAAGQCAQLRSTLAIAWWASLTR